MRHAARPCSAATALACGLLASLLVACGGGGADSPADATPSSSADTAAASAATAAPADCGIADFSATALARINQYRAAGASCGAQGSFAPAAAARWQALLTQAAAAHSLDMASLNYFSHTSADGRSMADRVNATGYAWTTLGENIAAGQVGVDAVVDGWMRSDGHCANLMNPAFDHIGLACVSGTSASRYRTYWTLNLARSR